MFSGHVKTEWLDDGRDMMLLETLTFVDSTGKLWIADPGDIINGASIPSIFLQIIGTPYIGKYRRPSVIHDVYCRKRTEPHKAVHRCFNEMMRVDGVDDLTRIRMFKSVWYFGPKWSMSGRSKVPLGAPAFSNVDKFLEYLDNLPCP